MNSIGASRLGAEPAFQQRDHSRLLLARGQRRLKPRLLINVEASDQI